VIEFMHPHGYNGDAGKNDGGGYFYHHCADLKITADPNLPLFTPPVDGGAPETHPSTDAATDVATSGAGGAGAAGSDGSTGIAGSGAAGETSGSGGQAGSSATGASGSTGQAGSGEAGAPGGPSGTAGSGGARSTGGGGCTVAGPVSKHPVAELGLLLLGLVVIVRARARRRA
jgi:hypothetical protein